MSSSLTSGGAKRASPAARGRDLLVAGVHQVGQRLELVRRGQARVPARRLQVDGRVDEQGLNQLGDGHVLQDAPLVGV